MTKDKGNEHKGATEYRYTFLMTFILLILIFLVAGLLIHHSLFVMRQSKKGGMT